MVNALKHIRVTCAVIKHEGHVLAAQRSASMSLPLKWEFPGGKIDKGESPEECLKREIVEELGIQVCIGNRLPTTTHQYKTFLVTLYPFICSIESGDIVLHEHCAITWLPPEKLHNLDWSEADIPVIDSFLAQNKVAI